ncbi:MAG: substrate-binding domain-containing protein, partial [Clostridiales bacterium]|jgi:inositol transport system substrate-binding protein|nr:substrate-binding domain-containing protein [Clostridiales bacterium]
MAMGAILALEAAGVRDDYFVAGVDATIDALQYMKEGRLDATVYQSADGQGRGAVDTMVKALENSLTENMIWIPFEPVTPDKVDEYIAKWE